MIITIFNWICAAASFLLTGMLTRTLTGRVTGFYLKKADEVVVAGIAFCTVYAEFFSLFYKTGVLCLAGLFLIDLVSLFICRREIIAALKKLPGILSENRAKAFVCLLFGFFFLMAATLQVEHVDTYLYHAQSIEWNELYGAVKGLGNLHARLAYNSAFFCLQALFSMRSLLGRSLHVLNGLFCLMAVSYSFCTLKIFREKRVAASDLVRMITFFYVLYSVEYISSPNSDILTLALVIYVMIKWTDMLEGMEAPKKEDYGLTAFLGVMTVFLVSLKLSAMPLVLLCLYPVVFRFKNRQWKDLIFMILCGTVVILPFFARNIILSGYLLYPFPALDLFKFDWKIPAFKAAGESREIMAWGRALNFKGEYDWPFSKWIHEWWQYLESRFKFFVLVDLAALAADAAIFVKMIGKKKDGAKLFLLGVVMVTWIYWFFSAPIIRYGMPFLLLLPSVTMLFYDKDVRICFAVVMQVFIITMLINVVSTFDAYNCKIFWPEDYPQNSGKENVLKAADGSDFTVYSPVSGGDFKDMPIYYQFPAVPSTGVLKEVEMRGNDLSDGFRYKGED